MTDHAVVVLTALAALCWVLNNDARAKRLAMLIRATRRSDPRLPRRRA